jgi:hypothetical protein
VKFEKFSFIRDKVESLCAEKFVRGNIYSYSHLRKFYDCWTCEISWRLNCFSEVSELLIWIQNEFSEINFVRVQNFNFLPSTIEVCETVVRISNRFISTLSLAKLSLTRNTFVGEREDLGKTKLREEKKVSISAENFRNFPKRLEVAADEYFPPNDFEIFVQGIRLRFIIFRVRRSRKLSNFPKFCSDKDSTHNFSPSTKFYLWRTTKVSKFVRKFINPFPTRNFCDGQKYSSAKSFKRIQLNNPPRTKLCFPK